MQRKQRWKLEGSGFWKKTTKQNKLNSRDNNIYALSSLSAQNRIKKKKKPNGKAEWKKKMEE